MKWLLSSSGRASQRNASARRPSSRRPSSRRPTSRSRMTGGAPTLRSLGLAVSALAASTLFVTVVWGMASGWLPQTMNDVRVSALQSTGEAGFRVRDVLVAGRDQTDREDILAAVGVQRGDPILAFEPHAAYDRVMSLPWIRSASVERRLPGTILIRIEERVPMALWQDQQQHHLIDREGNVLADRNLQPFAHLPMVVGADANRQARTFLDVLHQYPAISDRVEAAIRVGDRRWDLRLANGIQINLPETGLEAALDRLSRTLADVDLFERDVVTIDMRLEDRLIIETSPIAAERRQLPEEST